MRIFSSTSTATPLYSLHATSSSTTSNASQTCAAWLPATASSSTSSTRLVTSGMDGCLRLFEIPADALQLRGDATASQTSRTAKLLWSGAMSGSGNGLAAQPLSSVAVSSDGQSLVTGGWDGLVGIWSTNASSSSTTGMDVDEFDTEQHRAPDAERDADDSGKDSGEDDDEDGDGDGRRKRRKGASGKKTKATQHRLAALSGSHKPELVLRHATPVHAATSTAAAQLVPGSNAQVSSALFDATDDTAARVWSAGWNGAVRQWDRNLGGALVASKEVSAQVITCMTQLHATQMLATGHMDRSLGLWDFRESSNGAEKSNTSNMAVHIQNAHTAPVQAVRAHPSAAHLLASASLDGLVKGWDVRSHKQPLFTLSSPPSPSAVAEGAAASKAQQQTRAHARDGLLALDWTSDGQGLVAAGQDCRVSVWRGSGIGQQQLPTFSP